MDVPLLDDSGVDMSGDESEDKVDIGVPQNCELHHFLNTDKKWNDCVKRTKTLPQFCQLIGQITNLNMTKDNKIRIIMIITLDLVAVHRYLSPHWRVLQQHAHFANHDIL